LLQLNFPSLRDGQEKAVCPGYKERKNGMLTPRADMTRSLFPAAQGISARAASFKVPFAFVPRRSVYRALGTGAASPSSLKIPRIKLHLNCTEKSRAFSTSAIMANKKKIVVCCDGT
jgi:hypothetical protein